uniref:Uncharacterized protein n=1 Tax=Arundo donax TaxID=35708 RepID=A0A0A9F7Z9_ARUDO
MNFAQFIFAQHIFTFILHNIFSH